MYKIHRIIQERYLRMSFTESLFLVNLVNPVEIIRRLVEGRVARASLRGKSELMPQRSIAASASPGTNAARRRRLEIRRRELNLVAYSTLYRFVIDSNKSPARSIGRCRATVSATTCPLSKAINIPEPVNGSMK